ncbi:MAG: hypothetical protein M1820_003619 [Bogoriella megaspora]|nr:MAG: hypothetical protein M1820_003619 [Bogoriella megaspora]
MSSPPRKKLKLAELDADELYEITRCAPHRFLIGPQKEPFFISKKLLADCSDWFLYFLDPMPKATQPVRTINLPHDDPRAWRYFVYWLVNRNLPNIFSVVSRGQHGYLDLLVIKDLAGLWQFGSKISRPDLQNTAMNLLCNVLRDFIRRYKYETPDDPTVLILDDGGIDTFFLLGLLRKVPIDTELFEVLVECTAYHVAIAAHEPLEYMGWFSEPGFVQFYTNQNMKYIRKGLNPFLDHHFCARNYQVKDTPSTLSSGYNLNNQSPLTAVCSRL